MIAYRIERIHPHPPNSKKITDFYYVIISLNVKVFPLAKIFDANSRGVILMV